MTVFYISLTRILSGLGLKYDRKRVGKDAGLSPRRSGSGRRARIDAASRRCGASGGPPARACKDAAVWELACLTRNDSE